AVARMVWRPMLPLLAIRFLMEVGSIAEILVTGYLLRCFDSASEHRWYHGYSIAFVLLVIKGVCMQQFHIRELIEDEFSRVVSAIRLELFRLPLEPNGQRRLADFIVSPRMVGDLPRILSTFSQTCIQILGLWTKFAALYYVVGPLALIPVVSVVAMMVIVWGFELLVGPSYQWSTSISTYDDSISEIYQGIKAIKLYGWERMYLDPKLQGQDSDATRLPWYAPAILIAWIIVGAAKKASLHVATYIMFYLHTQSPMFAASALTSAYVLELDLHVGNLFVGKTGAGKSSLLLSISGELEMTAGTGGVAGSIAYLEQSPWIMNDTMRANVLFGRQYDAEFFIKVIHACALTEDIAMWPDADLTVIGERGINISGGQRARLALARTLYSRADIYVLDDPLSAVDAHVKRHILENVLLDTGMLAGKLRIITTNSGHILPYAHQVVTLTDGRAEVTMQTPQEYRAADADESTAEPPKAVPHDDDSNAEEQPVAVSKQPANNPDQAKRMGLDMLKNSGAVLSRSNALRYLGLQTLQSFMSTMLLFVEYHIRTHVSGSIINRTIRGAFVRNIIHAPMSFFDSTTRQHVSSAYDDGAKALAEEIPQLVMNEMIRLFNVGPHFVQKYMEDKDEKQRLQMHINALRNLVRDIAHFTDIQRIITRFLSPIELYRQYAGIEPEALYVVDDCRPAPSWPHAGKIEFCDYTMRYREDLEPALNGITFTIQPGEKIGIVGRTGAGKSTLVKSLFRLVHGTDAGQILIDGQDIVEMGVGDLRPRLGIIPQESTMFSGSFKRNLDPLQDYTIEDMWAALVTSGIAPKVAPPRAPTDGMPDDDRYDERYEETMAEWNHQWATAGRAMRLLMLSLYKQPKKRINTRLEPRHGLDRTAQSGSQGFSGGEQQLFSLCRVLMRMRRIIVLDEATADVDLETDRRMQQVFRDAFAGCTVLTIAHRLETIMASDRIVVMDKGRIAETGTPQELIDAGGLFAELVKANDFGS
ncbi:Multidrug resistance-associated protein 1, partial [Coemansia helicoidea]